MLAAAGRGERLGRVADSAAGQSPAALSNLDRPKAFAALRGRPLLAESLERLEASEWIDSIVVVAPPDWEEPVILLAEELGAGKVVASVAGGASRAESVRIGVGEVPDDAAVILVHDAARPLVSDEVVERLLAALNEGWDGAVPGLSLADTVKRVRDEAIVETLPRDELVAVQTPQAFVASVLRDAVAGGDEATDCSALVEGRGGRVKVVEGDPRLLKVTTADDLALVESWLDGASS
ncbi:MAG TPA: 2-C-methyl-D-erythritol 4-phosphate cytidylyltransferase [Gaiellaceae bacterium]|nr:2-C-methyl-D-erythritol 4-phosphate cytidylyltransferase [Gaiellaceae bacterium]